jgi:quercetin dioxygenase-like cupin family protein
MAMKMTIGAMLLSAGALAAGLVASARAADAPAVFREELSRVDLGNGLEAVQGRSGMGAGGDSGRHTHPGLEMVTLLEGTVEVTIDGQPPKTVKAGEAFMVPGKLVHRVRVIGNGPARFAPVWIIEKGQPIASPVK